MVDLIEIELKFGSLSFIYDRSSPIWESAQIRFSVYVEQGEFHRQTLHPVAM